jgi:Endonuclease/Exonuclease/phosphatase family
VGGRQSGTLLLRISVRLATWNVMVPVSTMRREAIRSHTDRVNADIWVLTEAHDAFTPGHAFTHSSSGGGDGHRHPQFRWVTIWSRYPVEPIDTSDDKRTAAVRVRPPSGAPFIVFGTVLPWIGSTWREHPSAGGVAFSAALSMQAEDWMQIRRDYPKDEFFVVGDLNQDMVSPHYYGSRLNRTALELALTAVGLTALTAGSGDPIRRDSAPSACIDHICARSDSTWRADPAVRWPDVPKPERWLSDHFGVSISFEQNGRVQSNG